MRFRAKVLTAGMAVELIDIDAVSTDEARRFVEASGAKLLDLHELRNAWLRQSGGKSFNLAVFNQQLHSLLDAGQPVVDAIDILGHNDRGGRNRAIYDTLLKGLKDGKQLSESMASLPSIFSPLYVAMVRASETTGTVRASIQRFMQYQRQVDEIRGKLVSAAIYPAILLSVSFIVIAFLMMYVVPRFSIVFDDVAIHNHAQPGFIQIWGGFVMHHTALAWSGFLSCVAVILSVALHPRTRAVLFRKVLAAPYIGEKVWILQMARMYRTLGMLLRSGVSVLAAMKMTAGSLPLGMQSDIQSATQSVAEGKPMSVVMAECGLSTEVAQRLLVAGESSGNLDDMMERIADFYDQEMATWIDTAGRLIEPALMVGIGLVIGTIVLMLYSPIFDLANAV
ncbi:MAG: type II secretion system F family protein [Burkholderiaceae bacterium]|nr:type II secretion system F family protein [Burkholderiaceae bacterium]